MYKQQGNIADYVFPLVRAIKNKAGRYEYKELVGTAFFIGNHGFALTAAHVLEQCFEKQAKNNVVLALFWEGTGWAVYEITSFEKHPIEDVGILHIDGESWTTIFQINDYPQNSSCEYHCWGYPHSVAKEVQQLYENVIERPDLIFTQGYIRRRISRELYPSMIFRGAQFYELSEQVGGGNSGAPVILRSSAGKIPWQFIGIYIGEKERGVVSYAVRAESFADWRPMMLMKSIKDESFHVT